MEASAGNLSYTLISSGLIFLVGKWIDETTVPKTEEPVLPSDERFKMWHVLQGTELMVGGQSPSQGVCPFPVVGPLLGSALQTQGSMSSDFQQWSGSSFHRDFWNSTAKSSAVGKGHRFAINMLVLNKTEF